MRTTIITIIAITLLILIGCEKEEIVECQVPTEQELEAIVKGNTLTLREALEQYATDNYGHYPESADSDTTVTGKVLIDYLPEGERLLNPFTGLKDQPINSIPSSPGEIGYYKYHEQGYILDEPYDHSMNVYFIKGYGTNSIIVEHDNIEDIEALIVEDCLTLQRAVEAWSSNYTQGYYPSSDLDSDDDGYSVVHYLPGGHLMENRFNMYYIEPHVWEGIPATMGAIGYKCIIEGVTPVGYTIMAVGFEPEVIIFQISVN